MRYLHKLLISILFIATFGSGNQNQINQLLKTIDKTKNLTGFIPLLEKQSQNSFGHTATTSPITVHNSRDDFTCILAKTVKGKGSTVMENKKNWHYWNPMSDEEIKLTRDELT